MRGATELRSSIRSRATRTRVRTRLETFGSGSPRNRIVASETARSPKFLQDPSARSPCSSTPVGLACQAVATRSYCLVSLNSLGSHGHWSLGAQSHGFRARCLRFEECDRSHSSQDSLSVDGQSLPNGIGYPSGLVRGFTSRHDDPPRAGFAWRNHGVHSTTTPFVRLVVAGVQKLAAFR